MALSLLCVYILYIEGLTMWTVMFAAHISRQSWGNRIEFEKKNVSKAEKSVINYFTG